MREIGEELGVATLLMGTIRRQSDRVRVNVELIDARTSRNLWADAFEGGLSDIFSIQNEIAQKLARRLELELSPETIEALEAAPDIGSEAYELLLRGRFLRNRETTEDLVRATGYLETVTELQPDDASAWALLGDVYFLRAFMDAEQQARPPLYAKAESAVQRALGLDEALPYAHIVRGLILAHRPPGDLAAGERALRRAIELDPTLANAHRELGILLLRSMGGVDDAEQALRAAERLEPNWALVKGLLVEARLARGDLVGARDAARQMRELGDPYRALSVPALSAAAFQRLDPLPSAVATYAEFAETGPGFIQPGFIQNWLVISMLLADRIADAERLAQAKLKADPNTVRFGYSVPGTAGVVALFSGDLPGAVGYLESALEIAPGPVSWDSWNNSALFSDYATLLGYALQQRGEAERALERLRETERFYTDRIAAGDTTIRARVGIAAVHALRGDEEAAYEWLQQAIDAGFYQYAELAKHPCFESLHGHDRFQEMMAGVRTRVEEMWRQVEASETGAL